MFLGLQRSSSRPKLLKLTDINQTWQNVGVSGKCYFPPLACTGKEEEIPVLYFREGQPSSFPHHNHVSYILATVTMILQGGDKGYYTPFR